MADRLPVVQGRESHWLPRYPPRSADQRPRATQLPAPQPRPSISPGISAEYRGYDRRAECLDRLLRPPRPLQAPLLLRLDARSPEEFQSVGRSPDPLGTREEVAPPQSRHLGG